MFEKLLPKEISFFDYFEQHSKLAIEACRELNGIAINPEELSLRVNRIKEIEHQADEVTHKCIDALHRTFITPFDRSDIHRLMKRLDDIVDSIDSAASRMAMYDLTELRLEMKQFTETLIIATTEINGAVRNLRHLSKNGDAVDKCCLAIYQAENEGDQILRSAIVRLFREEKDALTIIKWKEVFERLEKATDRCEEVANIVQGIMIEAS